MRNRLSEVPVELNAGVFDVPSARPLGPGVAAHVVLIRVWLAVDDRATVTRLVRQALGLPSWVEPEPCPDRMPGPGIEWNEAVCAENGGQARAIVSSRYAQRLDALGSTIDKSVWAWSWRISGPRQDREIRVYGVRL